eukprot:651970-Pyramimonas_sp.AAC.1
MAAGLPAQLWVCAVPCFCACYNATQQENGKTPWGLRLGGPFDAPLFPFGSAVRYLPPLDPRMKQPKLAPRTRVGIDLGYVQHAGGRVGPDRCC